MNRIAIALCALAACTPTQSARVLAPGKTQVSVGISRMTIQDDDEIFYNGEIRVAHGVSETTEIAAEIGRTPGAGTTYTNVAIAPKFQLTKSETSAVSVSLPVSLFWGEQGLEDVGGGTLGVFPTVVAGFDLSKESELVLAPRFGFAKPLGEGKSDPIYGLGVSIGVRFGDSATRSGITPSIGFLSMKPSGANESITFLMFGLGVSTGD